jgi:hypothetical protein
MGPGGAARADELAVRVGRVLATAGDAFVPRADRLEPMTTEALTIEHLERWVLSGAHWRVVEMTKQHALVDLCACTGEPVERLQSGDPTVIGYLRAAHSDLELPFEPSVADKE